MGPALFNIYMHDLPEAMDYRVSIGVYADDTAIAATSKSPKLAVEMLQYQINMTCAYMRK